MKPLAQYELHTRKGMDFRKDVILDLLNRFPSSTQVLMDSCMNINLASQATIHGDIQKMIKAKFISARVSKMDNRVVYLKTTQSGKKYLEEL